METTNPNCATPIR